MVVTIVCLVSCFTEQVACIRRTPGFPYLKPLRVFPQSWEDVSVPFPGRPKYPGLADGSCAGKVIRGCTPTVKTSFMGDAVRCRLARGHQQDRMREWGQRQGSCSLMVLSARPQWPHYRPFQDLLPWPLWPPGPSSPSPLIGSPRQAILATASLSDQQAGQCVPALVWMGLRHRLAYSQTAA